MSAISSREQKELERANGSGAEPVVFVHGLWLLASSWDRWRERFEDAGYVTLAPSWPDDPESVDEARRHPEVFARKTVKQVADHFADVVRQLSTPPAIVGHSFGGLIAQRLAGAVPDHPHGKVADQEEQDVAADRPDHDPPRRLRPAQERPADQQAGTETDVK